MAVGEEKWYSKLAATMDACVITVDGRLKVKVGDATASILDVAVTDFGMPLKSELPPNGGISKTCLGGSIVAAFFLDSFSSSSSNGLFSSYCCSPPSQGLTPHFSRFSHHSSLYR